VIYTFYSFKGGVGRTLALAHTAWMLARQRKVLVVDLDLEAPGLDAYLPPSEGCRGFAGLLTDWYARAPEDRAGWLATALRDPAYVRRGGPRGRLHFLPSGLAASRGDEGPDYLQVTQLLRQDIQAQRRDAGWPVKANTGFLAELRAATAKAFPYVLVDSRTGIADESFASTVLLSDAMVLCFRLNRTHLDGARRVLGNYLAREGMLANDPRLPVIPVVTPLPARGGADVAQWFADQIDPLFTRAVPVDDDTWVDAPLALFGSVVRLYEDPFLEIDERLLVDEQGALRPGFDATVPLVRGYQDLYNRLVALNVEGDPRALSGQQRRHARAGRPLVAYRCWVRRAERSLDAFNDLPALDDPEVVALAAADLPALLDAWEATAGADETWDDIALDWMQLYDQLDGHAEKGLRGGWLLRAHQAARGAATRALAALRLATARYEALLEAPAAAQAELFKETRAVLDEAIDGFAECEQEDMLGLAHQFAARVDSQVSRWGDALEHQHAAQAAHLAGHVEPDALELEVATAIALGLGEWPLVARLVRLQQESVVTATVSIRLGWTTIGERAIAAVMDDTELPPGKKFMPAVTWISNRDIGRYRVWIARVSQLDGGMRAVADWSADLVAGEHLAGGAVSLPPRANDTLCAVHRLWALYFEPGHPPPTAAEWQAFAAPNWEVGATVLLGWLSGENGPAQSLLAERLRLPASFDLLARTVLLLGSQLAVEGDAAGARRCVHLLRGAQEVNPAGLAVARNHDFTHVAHRVLARPATLRRCDDEGRAALAALWATMDAPALPEEPADLEPWSWSERLPIERMRAVATWMAAAHQEAQKIATEVVLRPAGR
jgi:hypothetical protein